MLTPRRLAFLAVVALLGLAILSPVMRTGVATALLLPHFFPGSVPRPLEALRPAPSMTTLHRVPNAPGRMVADIYRPGGEGRKPTLILLLGVNPLPRGHEQVTTLASGLARSGLITVVAESDALVAGEIRPEEVDNLVALFTHLERDPDVDPARIGFAGFCIGAVLELLAASDPRIADRVAFVNAFSVYADATDVVRAVLSRSMPTPTGPAPWAPDPLTREVFYRHMIEALPSVRDKALLRRELIEATPLTSPELQVLTPVGRQLRELLQTTEVDRINGLLDELPAYLTASLRLLSPRSTVHRLRAETFLMHDLSDTYLPVSGARELAMMLPPQAGQRYTEFRLFAHVVPGGIDDPVLFAGEMVKLFRHMNAVLSVALHGPSRPSRA